MGIVTAPTQHGFTPLLPDFSTCVIQSSVHSGFVDTASHVS